MRIICLIILLAIITATAAMAAPVSPLSSDIDKIEARYRGEFTTLYNKCRAGKIPLDYPNVAKETLVQFIPYARTDVKNGMDDRAKLMVTELGVVLDRSIEWMDYYLKNPKLVPNVRRFQTGKVKIDGTSFIADRIDTNGKKDRGPVFFVGYGHFGQVRKDMPRWPRYGINIIQVEVGPSVTLTTVDEVSLKAVKEIRKVLDDAAKHNVMVNVLLSPHYFPGWALEKWPKLAKGGGGFFGYCIDEEEAKLVLDRFNSIAVPILKDHPALHSICLSNEPSFERAAGCENTRPLWNAYLAKVHGDIKTLNERYGTNYANWDDVPFASYNGFSESQYCDYLSFISERLANWHMFMADSVHRYAPDVQVHAKWRAGELWNRQSLDFAVDPELYTGLDINGCDCWFCGGMGDYPINWREQNKSYDLMRSLAKKPIFNSENHPTFDRRLEPHVPEHFQAGLWEGAIRGQSATTMWVWDRSEDKNSDFYGNVIDRPACAEITGRTCLDLNRFAEEVTAFQNVKSPVAVLYTQVSEARNENYLQAAGRAYEALQFTGVKIDWITEKQLASGKGDDYKMIVLPDATNVSPQTLDAVEKLPKSTKLVWIGESLAKDPYGRSYPPERIASLRSSAIMFQAQEEAQKMWPVLLSEMDKQGALPDVRVVDALTGDPVWGVEYLPAMVGGRQVVYIINLTYKPVYVKLVRGGQRVAAKDLLSLGGNRNVRMLKPMAPVMAEL